MYLFPYVCFACRKAFKREYAEGALAKVCPHCGGQTHVAGRNFKPPKRTDDAQWEKVRLLFANGFRFFTLHEANGKRVRYPTSLSEAHAFIETHRARARNPAPV